MNRLQHNAFELRNFVVRMLGMAAGKLGTLLLPTLATSVLTLEGYTDFAFAYVIGTAVSAFSGESLSATVSKYASNSPNILRNFLHWAPIVYVATVGLTSVGYLLTLTGVEISVKHIQILVGIYLLCAFNIFTPSLLNLVYFYETSNRMVIGIISMVLFAVSAAYFFGKMTGYVGFIAGYSGVFVLTLFTFLYLLDRKNRTPVEIELQHKEQFFRSYFSIALAAGFGGPVHGICMILLGSTALTGRLELAIFVLYYPLAMVVSFVPSLNSTFVIRRLSRHSASVSRNILTEIFLTNILLMVMICLPLMLLSPVIHQYYQNRIGMHSNLLPIMLLIGFLIGIFSVSSSILISLQSPRYLIKPSIAQAIFYGAATYVGVTYFEFDSAAVAWTLSASLMLLLIYHGLLIFQSGNRL
jgi:O-antigen/teichoic acid export membrane protein